MSSHDDEQSAHEDRLLMDSLSPRLLLQSRLAPGSPPDETPSPSPPNGSAAITLSPKRENPNNSALRISAATTPSRREWLRAPEPAQLQTNAVRNSRDFFRASASYPPSSSGDSLDTIVLRRTRSPKERRDEEREAEHSKRRLSSSSSSSSSFSSPLPEKGRGIHVQVRGAGDGENRKSRGWSDPPRRHSNHDDPRSRLASQQQQQQRHYPVRSQTFHGIEDQPKYDVDTRRRYYQKRRSWQPSSSASTHVQDRRAVRPLSLRLKPPSETTPESPSPPMGPRRLSLVNMHAQHVEDDNKSDASSNAESSSFCSRFCRCAAKARPRGRVAWYATRLVVVLLCYGAAWAIFGSLVLPCSDVFAFILLVALAALGGFLARMIYLPPLVGMLIAGFLYGNIPLLVDSSEKGSCGGGGGDSSNSSNSSNSTTNVTVCGHCFCLNQAWSSALRSVALVVILSRAGLGLNPRALKRLKYVVLRLAFLPCLAESLIFAIVSRFLLDLPWAWAFTAGFVVAAVSPAVVVPGLLDLQKRKYGVEKGIPTMVIAAASIDDVLAISGFGISLGLAFSEGNLLFNIFRGPLELVLGLGGGILVGVVAWILPSEDMSTGFKARNRLLYLLACGLFAVFGSRQVHFTGAGALGVLVASFVCAYGWKDDSVIVAVGYNMMWQLAQPMLFGLIGAAVEINCLTGNVVGLAIACMVIALTVRIAVSYVAVLGQGFSTKEKLFVALSWLPKATVQAAVGSIAYDTALERNNSQEEVDLGRTVLIIAFLVIVCSAPLGAAAIKFSGPRLLQKESDQEEPQSDEIRSPKIRLADMEEEDDNMGMFDDGEGAGEEDVRPEIMGETNV